MSFVDQFALSEGPERKCPEKFGGLFSVFKPELLVGHERAGYEFMPHACLDVVTYDPNYCVPGDLKMEPGGIGPAKHAVLGMIQTALSCSYGLTPDELRAMAKEAIDDKIERAVEADFIAFLDSNDTPSGGPLQAKCALAEAAQYLSNNSQCGLGIITGPVSWFEQLENTLVWQAGKGYHTDFVGNIVFPHSVDNDTVYALDAAVAIKISEILIMDDFFPGMRNVNDRVVRAEQLFTVAIDSCSIGSFTVGPCCDCGGGGGGGGGNVAVTNFPAVQATSVNNFPPTDTPAATITISAQQFDVVPGTPWTPAAVPAGRLVGLSYTVVGGTVTTIDGDGSPIAAIPTGFTAEWNTQDDHSILNPPQSITADPGGRAIVSMSVATP